MVAPMPEVHPAMREWNESRRIRLDDDELSSLYREGHTAKELAAHFGCSTHPIKQALRRLGLRRPAKRRPGRGIGRDNPAWKGGRRVRPDGYVVVWTPHGERLEHQIVAEQMLGRELLPGEIVHHVNENREDNRRENLRVMTQSEHIRHHLPDMHAARYGR